jgi:hypothetical protein
MDFFFGKKKKKEKETKTGLLPDKNYTLRISKERGREFHRRRVKRY